ncbi:hypothetical protein PGTUg99_028900 [Puccinia graminis f. sp. tritici]|uniref:Uncharacterized protein n=1 Tax=Puccinia graminis f. sp. tritici TaxID=56615 RepID=A0A5B0R5Z1_PUCGR|nr:hypothetical protein PGTUg99_028900 [Puccinia graminis f. sp. tritici]
MSLLAAYTPTALSSSKPTTPTAAQKKPQRGFLGRTTATDRELHSPPSPLSACRFSPPSPIPPPSLILPPSPIPPSAANFHDPWG